MQVTVIQPGYIHERRVKVGEHLVLKERKERVRGGKVKTITAEQQFSKRWMAEGWLSPAQVEQLREGVETEGVTKPTKDEKEVPASSRASRARHKAAALSTPADSDEVI